MTRASFASFEQDVVWLDIPTVSKLIVVREATATSTSWYVVGQVERVKIRPSRHIQGRLTLIALY